MDKPKKYYYESSNADNFKSNVTFQELQDMTDEEFTEWCELLRSEVQEQWDNHNIPATANFASIDRVIENWKKLRPYNTNDFLYKDPNDDECIGIIANYNKFASGINQFFPTMGKTKITKAGENPENSTSIYDHFVMPELRKKFDVLMFQKVKRDVMYSFSKCVTDNYKDEYGVESVQRLFERFNADENQGIMVVSQKSDKPNCDGYLTVNVQELKELKENGLIKNVLNTSHVAEIEDLEDEFTLKNDDVRYYNYLVKIYERKPKLFPALFQVFKMSMGQPAVNFPPLTAKFLYEYYTQHVQGKVTIYDPSSGWGGRILGAMSSQRRTHYVGTDPNPDNFIDELGISRYEYVANFFNDNCVGEFDDPNTCHIFQSGSENISEHPDFQQYKGNLDFVFTSPPYFNREQYSQDENQSFKKFGAYEDWKENFLRPTLTNAYNSLKNDRYLAWNIANIKVPRGYIELEEDSKKILEELGAEYKGKWKMLMSRMIGIDNETETLNSVQFKGSHVKYEPIFIFYKK